MRPSVAQQVAPSPVVGHAGPEMKDYLRAEQAKRDAVAAAYDGWYLDDKGALFDVRERQVFADAVGDAHTVLDLGCGTGRIAAAVRLRAGAVVGSDLSAESLHVFRSGLELPGVVADASWGLPFAEGVFEAITSCGVFSRLRKPEVERALNECQRVLCSGGLLVFNVYNARYWRSPYLKTAQAQREVASELSVARVVELAHGSGLALEKAAYYKTLPFKRLNAGAWLAVDRLTSSLPLANAHVAAHTLYFLRKPAAGT